MKENRQPVPRLTLRERVVGEDQWIEGRGTTLREFLGIALVWVGVGFSLFMLFLASANVWLVGEPVTGWPFYGRTVGLVVALIVVWSVTARLLSRVWLVTGVPVRVALVLVFGGAGVASSLTFATTLPEIPEEPMFTEIGGQFAFGPYPTPELLGELRDEGFHGVVSILEPDASSDEAALLVRERTMVEETGLHLVSAPLFSQGELVLESLTTLEGILEHETDRYYVHGITEDSKRLDLVRRLLLRLAGRRVLLAGRLEAGTVLERGPVYRLAPDVHLTPFPTDPELLEYLVASPVRTVVVLLDPDSREDRRWIEYERTVLERLDFVFLTTPLHAEPFDPEQALAAADLVRTRERPVVVQTFLTPSVAATALRQTWATGLPSLPPAVFRDSLSGGGITVIAGHVATGPRPVEREFGWLHRRGVRAVVAFDGLTPAERRTDRALSDVAGLEWYFLEGDEERLLETMASGGPWYVYGGDVEGVGARITERFGPPLADPADEENGGTEEEE